MAKASKLPYVLILEDDAAFRDEFDNRLQLALNELPDNWDALWMGGTVVKCEPYSAVLKRLWQSTGGYCILMRETMYDACIEILETEKFQADVSYMKIQSKFNVFRTVSNLILHKPGWSTIQKINVNHADLAR